MDKEKICRFCLALDVHLLSIYNSRSAGMGCVADMLKQVTKLMPQPDDNMPEKACLQCISEINRCYVFKMKCENSDRTLRQLLPEAVPEPLDNSSKKVDGETRTSSLIQTTKERKPVNHRSVQTVEEVKRVICHKEIQTDFEFSESGEAQLVKHNENLENIFIYEEFDTKNEKTKKRIQSPPESKQVTKKLCLEICKVQNVLTIEESQLADHQPSEYILLEDSNGSGEIEIHARSIENKKNSECDGYEYYEPENEESHDEGKNNLYQDDGSNNENLKIQNAFEIESTDGRTKSDDEAEALIKPRSNYKNKPKGQYKCSQCIMTFVSIKVLKRHLANMHDIKDAEIVIDYLPPPDANEISTDVDENRSKLYDSSIELRPEDVAKPQLMPRERKTPIINEEMLTNAKYFCNICQARFAQRKTLTYHMKHQVCMTNNFKCNICDSIFVSEKNLETHKLTHETPHKCLECDTVSKTMEELSEHMIKTHNRSASNQCQVCKKVFTMKTSLIDHLRIHSGEKPFLCTICGKSFRQNSNLRQHLIRHTNEKNFKCDMCPNAYVTKAELFCHKRTHTGDHPFKCDICQARFTTSCSLKKHIRKHTGERPYACEFCPMRFAALNVLKNHRRTHTGEKPYKCIHCSKAFTQKGDCLMHERTHLNDDFKCFCESKFSKKSNLTYHIKTQHPEMCEKEIQDFLEKSVGDGDNAEYQITLMENSDEKESLSNNEELLEIAMEDVM